MSFPADLLAGPNHQDSAPALIHANQSWTHADLRSQIGVRIDLLLGQGLKAGEVVLARDEPALDLVLMQHALAKTGVALFPYRAGLPSANHDALAAMTGAEWRWSTDQQRLVRIGFAPVSAVASSDPAYALLVKTSGSSGAPKVAMLTVENVLTSAATSNAHLNLVAGDIWLGCLRMSHVGGLSITYRCALAGATLLLQDGFAAAEVKRMLWEHPVTHISLVPPMLARLLDLDTMPPPWLRVVLVGGQALGRSLAQRALDSGWPLHLTYGMTETSSQIATTARLTGRIEDCGLVGPLLSGVCVDAGACGTVSKRLRIRGPVVMAGYANPNRLPGSGLNGGWFESADLGCVMQDGQLKIFGRADDILVIGGNNVSLRRVEEAVSQATGVRDAVVVGLHDPVWGARLAVAFSGASDSTELERWCQRMLSGSERPRIYLRLPRLPLLDSGKYDRARIKALVGRFGRIAPSSAAE
jgi:o-succinylbenzoate---CoA ligase